MKRAVLAAVAVLVVILGAGVVMKPWAAVEAQPQAEQEMTVRVAQRITATEDGNQCVPFGVLDTEGPRPFRQVIITNPIGAIVGKVDLQVGETLDGDCVVVSTFNIYDALFYTFTVDGQYRHTVSRDELVDADWTYDLWLGIYQ